MRSQMRPTAVLALLNVLTGVTPGRLFQVATNLSSGHPPTSSASSFGLAKESNGVVLAAAAASGESNALIVLSLSIVNVVMIVLLGAALCAVMTWITPICLKSKAIVREIDAKEYGTGPGRLKGRLPPGSPRCPLVKGHGTKYGRKKEELIAALLTQKNHEEAAHAVGIDLKTLKRWMQLPEFIEDYRRARWTVVDLAGVSHVLSR